MLSRTLQLLGQPRVGDRDGALVGKPLQQRELVVTERVRLLERDRQRPDHLAARSKQRRGRHATQPQSLRDRLIGLVVRNAWIDEVVLGMDHLAA